MYHRCCAYCGAQVVCSDGWSRDYACKRCAGGKNPGTADQVPKPHDAWAAGLKVGGRCYVQPYAAWRGLARSQVFVVDRSGDDVTVQILGLPETRQVVGIAHLAQTCMAPRLKYAVD